MLSWKCRKMQRESLQLLSVAYLAIKAGQTDQKQFLSPGGMLQ
ncbi:hypothetical protein FOTG_07414 [Fusarium oxysporum f. sp. vasinfectum 25433]|uniref:Uncharacterized protein n=1 Tax=Fusarium oxysporum f. sp. vasinfectum 25433 TaxID=1089449 RepID=X0LZA3_FUSOX|nr:hypothetical protein FOTG_07414 [Fusarium oxysporum f. sp. vasinfectum 25433]